MLISPLNIFHSTLLHVNYIKKHGLQVKIVVYLFLRICYSITLPDWTAPQNILINWSKVVDLIQIISILFPYAVLRSRRHRLVSNNSLVPLPSASVYVCTLIAAPCVHCVHITAILAKYTYLRIELFKFNILQFHLK